MKVVYISSNQMARHRRSLYGRGIVNFADSYWLRSHIPLRSSLVVLRLWSDNVNWNSCILKHVNKLELLHFRGFEKANWYTDLKYCSFGGIAMKGRTGICICMISMCLVLVFVVKRKRRLEKSLVMSINFSGNQCRSSLKVCGLVKKFLNLRYDLPFSFLVHWLFNV